MTNGTDLLQVVTRAVAARQPVDSREKVSIERGLAALERLADPFDRDADAMHVTGSAIVSGRRGVLLLRHRKLHIWVQPGGHLEPGESPWAAARRESEEETGLSLDFAPGVEGTTAGRPELVHVDVHPSAGEHIHLDLRYALVGVGGDGDEPRPPQGESQEVVWYRWPDAIAIADPGLAGLLRHCAPVTGADPRSGFE